MFVSAAALQSTDAVARGPNKVCGGAAVLDDGPDCEVYAWHNGAVNLISDGEDSGGSVYAGMSSDGSDIFFQTTTQLVGQDTDTLGDIYDARIDGGFPAPPPEPLCSGEACQGTQSSAPTFGTPGSQSFTGGGNQGAPPFKEVLEPETKPKSKPLTRGQKLSRALSVCRRDKRSKKRERCERAARKRFHQRSRLGRRAGKR